MRPAAVALVCLTCAAAVRPLWAAGPTPNELLETGGLGLLVQFHEAARQAGRSAAVPTTGQNAWGFTYTPTEALSPGFVWTKIVERGTTTYAPANQAPVRAEYVMRHAAHCRVWLDRLTEMPGDDGLWPNARARKQAFAREPDTWRALDVGDFGLASGQPVVSQVDAFAGPVRAVLTLETWLTVRAPRTADGVDPSTSFKSPVVYGLAAPAWPEAVALGERYQRAALDSGRVLTELTRSLLAALRPLTHSPRSLGRGPCLFGLYPADLRRYYLEAADLSAGLQGPRDGALPPYGHTQLMAETARLYAGPDGSQFTLRLAACLEDAPDEELDFAVEQTQSRFAATLARARPECAQLKALPCPAGEAVLGVYPPAAGHFETMLLFRAANVLGYVQGRMPLPSADARLRGERFLANTVRLGDLALAKLGLGRTGSSPAAPTLPGATAARRLSLTISPAEVVADLGHTVTVQMTVTDGTGPVADAVVSLRGPDGAPLSLVSGGSPWVLFTTGPDGTVTTQLQVGQFDYQGPLVSAQPGRRTVDLTAALAREPQTTAVAQLALLSLPRVTLRVRTYDNQPVSRARVEVAWQNPDAPQIPPRLRPLLPRQQAVFTAEDGTISLPYPDGARLVAIRQATGLARDGGAVDSPGVLTLFDCPYDPERFRELVQTHLAQFLAAAGVPADRVRRSREVPVRWGPTLCQPNRTNTDAEYLSVAQPTFAYDAVIACEANLVHEYGHWLSLAYLSPGKSAGEPHEDIWATCTEAGREDVNAFEEGLAHFLALQYLRQFDRCYDPRLLADSDGRVLAKLSEPAKATRRDGVYPPFALSDLRSPADSPAGAGTLWSQRLAAQPEGWRCEASIVVFLDRWFGGSGVAPAAALAGLATALLRSEPRPQTVGQLLSQLRAGLPPDERRRLDLLATECHVVRP